MRTTVIPAQITTVEDKIAGNLNFIQVILIMAPLMLSDFLYIGFPPTMRIAPYKIPIAVIALAVCLTLSLRIKGKVVINWLMVLLRYTSRPKYYLFDKNDAYLRELYLPELKVEQVVAKKVAKKDIKISAKKFGMKELMDLRGFIQNPDYSLSLKPDKKGGLYVALEQVES